jgi:hypothetical protein
LGPNLIEHFESNLVMHNLAMRPYAATPCIDGDVDKNGEEIPQRNELRFQNPDYWHPTADGYWYTLRFRLQPWPDQSFPPCISARWVVTQWKFSDMTTSTTSSPFLSARFDNTVYNIQTQDGDCKCLIAKAAGNTRPNLSMSFRMRAQPATKLYSVNPMWCEFAGEEGQAGPRADSCTYPNKGRQVPIGSKHLRLYAPDPAGPMALPDPKTDFITMTFFIRAEATPQRPTQIDVYADGQFIVRAVGDLMSGAASGNRMKFKFGNYRARNEVNADMVVTDVCFSHDVNFCDPAIANPVPDNLPTVEQ